MGVEYLVFLLSSAGLHVNSKFVVQPVSDILWLGKRFYAAANIIDNTVERISHVCLLLWTLRVCRCTPRALQRLLGAIQWLGFPFSCMALFLARAYAHL